MLIIICLQGRWRRASAEVEDEEEHLALLARSSKEGQCREDVALSEGEERRNNENVSLGNR